MEGKMNTPLKLSKMTHFLFPTIFSPFLFWIKFTCKNKNLATEEEKKKRSKEKGEQVDTQRTLGMDLDEFETPMKKHHFLLMKKVFLIIFLK